MNTYLPRSDLVSRLVESLHPEQNGSDDSSEDTPSQEEVTQHPEGGDECKMDDIVELPPPPTQMPQKKNRKVIHLPIIGFIVALEDHSKG
jgi:hypothetical protein